MASSESPAYFAHEVMGPLLIGSFFSLLFYGISCVQVFFYFQTYPDDKIYFKFLVATIWVLETIQSGLTISFNNTYLIHGFGDLSVLTYIQWDLVVCYQIGLISILLVNIYFTWRVWKFSKNTGGACLLLFLAISRFGLAIAATILAFIYNTFKSFDHHAHVILAITLVLAVIEDTLMALSLAYCLNSQRVTRSAQLVTWLLAYTVATGAFTSVIAIVEMAALWASRNTLLYLSFAMMEVKVYANSALLSLNQRQYLEKPRKLSERVIAPNMHISIRPQAPQGAE